MTSVLWFLIVVSGGYNNTGNATLIAKFKDEADCAAVQKSMSVVFNSAVVAARCVKVVNGI